MIKTQIHVKHILVKHQYELDDILRKHNLNAENFSEIATKYSICSSAKQGGDLGWQNASRFVEEFAFACKQIQIGQISKPVRTAFGFHLILKLAEK